MERLTTKNKKGVWTAYKGDGSVSFSGEHVDRLAAYEDTGYVPEDITRVDSTGLDLRTLLSSLEELNAYRSSGLTPEQVTGLSEAMSSGRLEVLPCRVGEDFYAILQHVTGRRSVTKYTCYSFTDKGIFAGNNSFHPFSELGRTVFLTREEAESALRMSMAHGI